MMEATLDTLTPVTLKVDRQAILAYARITGDFNPIHVDPEFAARTPLGAVIAHGTLSLNLIWQSLAATFGGEAMRGAAIDVRFTKPVRDGDIVEAGGRRSADAPERFEVWVRNQAGGNVIEGTAVLSPVRGGGS